MILISVISIIIAFLIIGSLIKEKYALSTILVLVSIILAVINDKVDTKIHELAQYRLTRSALQPKRVELCSHVDGSSNNLKEPVAPHE